MGRRQPDRHRREEPGIACRARSSPHAPRCRMASAGVFGSREPDRRLGSRVPRRSPPLARGRAPSRRMKSRRAGRLVAVFLAHPGLVRYRRQAANYFVSRNHRHVLSDCRTWLNEDYLSGQSRELVTLLRRGTSPPNPGYSLDLHNAALRTPCVARCNPSDLPASSADVWTGLNLSESHRFDNHYSHLSPPLSRSD
jgi:hypothetical protein